MNDELDNPGGDRGRNSGSFSDDEIIQQAKVKTSPIGMLMIFAALLMFVSSFTSLAVVFGSGKDYNIEMLEWMKGFNKDPQVVAELQKQIDQRKNMDPKAKMAENLLNAGSTFIGIVGNALVLYAGICMRSLKSYGMCIVGSAASFLINGCCCFCFPVGIWALIVLANPNVKEGFTLMKRRNSLAQ